jgi:Na+/proline symporter
VLVAALFLLTWGNWLGFQIYRYVSRHEQRQQTKWLVFAGSISLGCLILYFALQGLVPAFKQPDSLYQLAYATVTMFVFLSVPLALGIAILRYRLWDIDVLIRRTLVYSTLTVILTAAYVGLVIGLQALLRGLISQDNNVAIVLSTLVIAVLFQPLRSRIQRVIDRRFYRRKYDAARTIAAFSARLRSEVDLDQLREELLAAVQETMQPAHVSLWVRPTEPARKDQTTGISSALPGEAAEKVS